MKKKIIIAGLLMGVLSLNSCVKDNESDAVRDQRNAQTEKLKAEALKALAEAKQQEIANAYEESIAALKKQKEEYNVKAQEYMLKQSALDLREKELDAALRDNDEVQAEKLKAAVETAKAEELTAKEQLANAELAYGKADEALQKDIKRLSVSLAAELAKIEKSESLDAKSAYLKVLVDEAKSRAGEYNGLVVQIANKQKDLVTEQKNLAGLKAGIVEAKEYAKAQIANKEAEIGYKRAEIAAYENVLKSADFGGKTFEEVQKLLGQANANVEKLGKEVASLKEVADKDVQAKDEAKEVFTTSAGQQELAFFKALEDLKKVSTTFVKNESLGVYNLDVENKGLVGENSVTFAEEMYSSDNLVSRFVNSIALDNKVDELEINAQPLEKAWKDKQADQKTAQQEYDQAKKEWQQDKDDAGKQANFKSKSDALKTAKEDTETAKEAYENGTKSLKAIKEAKAIIYEQSNIDAVVAKVKEFSNLQGKAIASVEKYDAKVKEEKTATEEKGVYQGYVDGTATVLGANEIRTKIDALYQEIETLQKDIAGSTTISSKEEAIKVSEAKIAKLEMEIKELEAQQKAYKTAYDAALEALENYKA